MKAGKHLDFGTLAIMAATFALFTGSVLVKGFSHDLMLEAGVFLVSVKLMIMLYRTGKANEELKAELAEIKDLLKGQGEGQPRP
jgi:hypothetical protein